jgi:hypothetical protein
MRWFVEITQLGAKADPESTVCVEAPQWQPALQKARAIRGDGGALGNFSIELLDDGYRAIDPMSRIRYVVRRAPDDAQLTNGASVAPPPVSVGEASKAPVTSSEAPKPAESAKPVDPPNKVASQALREASLASATVPFSAKGTEDGPTTKPVVSVPSPSPDAKKGPSGAPAAALPSFVVVGSREDNPSESSPLTYREYMYAVGQDTKEEDAKRLILERFEHVRGTLEVRSGRFVNLAVFDHVFHGRPQRRPVVTLTWKDWKGDSPELFYPLREGRSMPPSGVAARLATAPPVTMGETPKPPAPPVSGPRSSAKTAEPTPVVPAESPKSAAQPASGTATSTLASAESTARPKPDPEPRVAVVQAPSKPEPEPAKAESKPEPAKESAKAEPVKAEPVKAEPAKAEPAKAEPAKAEPTKVEPTKASKPVAKAEAIPETKPVPTVASAGARPTPLPKSGKRLTGDDLLTELFEAFGDLHFVQDALAGADFVLELTLEKLPSEVGLVSMFDMNTREFVIVRQSGGPRSAITMRQPEKAPLAFSAMRRRHAVVVADVAEAERAMDARWRAIGVELKSLVCTPIELSGRYLGLIELANPIDGHAFNEGDGNALTYIGQQFAEFVAARGVVVDPAQIRGEEEKPAPPPPSPKSGSKASKTNPGTKGR